MSVEFDLSVEDPGWQRVPDLEGLIRRALEQARRRCGVTLAKAAEISVLLSDDTTIRELNREWRGLDKPTNVLSFPAPSPRTLADRRFLGDLAFAFDTIRQEADRDHKQLADHLSHLVVHGFLHLVGFDHETNSEADAMEALEIRILAELGIADPYAETEVAEAAAL